jgi:PadR family transcriptional regulator, regulatory protein PadR
MPRSDSLGQFEQLVLTSIVTLGDNAYGITIHKKIHELVSSKTVTLGAIYVALDRLEEKGFVSSCLSKPTAARGGRAKRCYILQGAGERALKESLATARRMAASVTPIWGDLDKEYGQA